MNTVLLTIFGIAITVAAYIFGRFLQIKTHLVILNPILVAMAIIILVLKGLDISYDGYMEGGKYLEWLLKPGIVALGVPLYEQLAQIKKQTVLILASQVVACIVGVVVVVWVAHLLGASHPVALSISPKSATTPIAIEVSRVLKGIPALTAMIVILTGIFGAVCGLTLLRLFGVKSSIAGGLALGAGAHAVGTAHALQLNRRLGVYSSLGLIVNGTLTGVLTPYIVHFMGF